MHFSANTIALAAMTFTAFTTASPIVANNSTSYAPAISSPNFWGLANSSVTAKDVLSHLENTGAIEWIPAAGGGYTVSIDDDTWEAGITGAALNVSFKRSAPEPFLQTRDIVSTGLIDKLAGSLSCYGSGTSDLDTAIASFAGAACKATIDLLLPPGAKAAAKGAYQLWKSGQTTDTSNDLSYIKFGAKFLTSSWTSVNTHMCEDAFNMYNAYCQEGDSASTQGGVLSLGSVIQFTIDPTADNSNN